MVQNQKVVEEQISVLVSRFFFIFYVSFSRLKSASHRTSEDNLLLKLNDQFPHDIGVFAAYIFNYLVLKPGQAIFIDANEPHAYISGNLNSNEEFIAFRRLC